MTRVYLHLSLIPLVLIFAVVLLIHAQPYDDRELREVLLPEGCPAPCFMGIRPGVTTSKEALAILERHEWVADLHVVDVENPYQILWAWSENAPDVLKKPPLVFNGEVISNDKIVSAVMFSPQWAIGDIVLAWGLPADSQTSVGSLIPVASPWKFITVRLVYQAQGFRATGAILCPFRSRLWVAPTRLEITNQFYGIATGAVYAINQTAFFANLRATSQRMCGA